MEEKKKNQKESKKKVVKKVSKEKKEKSALPQEESFGVRFKRFISSYHFLYTAFGFLFIIVILLAIMTYTKSRENAGTKSNIVFSIIEKDTQSYLDMDLETLVGKEYTLKVTNYRGKKMNTVGATYTITITNNSDAELVVLKNNKGENLMTDQKMTVIEGEKLGGAEKEEVVYYFRLQDGTNIKAGDKIRIEVAS